MTSRTSKTTSEDSLAETLYRLREELAVIRQVLDEIAGELQWANRNREPSVDAAGSFRRITSMPLDPSAQDWAERINQFSADDLPCADMPPTPYQSGRLF
jgi:hypothetical protein